MALPLSETEYEFPSILEVGSPGSLQETTGRDDIWNQIWVLFRAGCTFRQVGRRDNLWLRREIWRLTVMNSYQFAAIEARKLLKIRSKETKPTEERKRERCYDAYRKALATGKLKRLPCRICGDKQSNGHHVDYDEPLEVDWLCDKHHALEHSRLGWGSGRKAKRQMRFQRETG